MQKVSVGVVAAVKERCECRSLLYRVCLRRTVWPCLTASRNRVVAVHGQVASVDKDTGADVWVRAVGWVCAETNGPPFHEIQNWRV